MSREKDKTQCKKKRKKILQYMPGPVGNVRIALFGEQELECEQKVISFRLQIRTS